MRSVIVLPSGVTTARRVRRSSTLSTRTDEAQAFELGELTADGRVVAVHAGGEFDDADRAEALDADQQGKQGAVEPDAGRRDERLVALRLVHDAHDFEQGHVKRAKLCGLICVFCTVFD